MGDRAKGVLAILASALGFSVMAACVRLADDFGSPLPAIQKSFFRNIVAAVLAAAMFARKWKCGMVRPTVPRGSGVLLLLRAALGTVGIFANFYAISRIPLGDAAMLNRLAPFCTVLFSWLFLSEKTSSRQALAVAGAFAGAMLVVKPSLVFAESMPALVGLVGGVAAGGAYTCVRALGVRKVDGALIVLFFSVFSTLASLPFIAFDHAPMTALQVLILFGAGLGALVGQFGVTAAYRFAAARDIAAYDYSNVVFSAVFGLLLFGQTPDILSWLGFAMIFVMAFVINRPGNPANRPA